MKRSSIDPEVVVKTFQEQIKTRYGSCKRSYPILKALGEGGVVSKREFLGEITKLLNKRYKKEKVTVIKIDPIMPSELGYVTSGYPTVTVKDLDGEWTYPVEVHFTVIELNEIMCVDYLVTNIYRSKLLSTYYNNVVKDNDIKNRKQEVRPEG